MKEREVTQERASLSCCLRAGKLSTTSVREDENIVDIPHIRKEQTDITKDPKQGLHVELYLFIILSLEMGFEIPYLEWQAELNSDKINLYYQ